MKDSEERSEVKLQMKDKYNRLKEVTLIRSSRHLTDNVYSTLPLY